MQTAITWLPVAALAHGVGCTRSGASLDDATTKQMLESLMPAKVEIVQAFTGFHSFDGDDVPDGIELRIQPVDADGRAVKAAGTMRAELYAYQPASGIRQGERMCEPWHIELRTLSDQRSYWSIATEMYEIKLEFPAGIRPAGSRYLLSVTYTTPLSTHLTDECVLEYRDAGRVASSVK